MQDNPEIDYKKIGKEKFCKFCNTLKELLVEEKIKFDLIIAVGNTGRAVGKFTELVFEYLKITPPPKLEIPYYRFLPGYEENESKLFDNSYFIPTIVETLKLIKPAESVLFVDDEIGRGLTATGCLNLVNEALKKLGRAEVKKFYIVAEDCGFHPNPKYTQMIFRPFDKYSGQNNAIFFISPIALQAPIIKFLGEDEEFAFHKRTSLLLGLPIKDFNYGKPIYDTKFNELLNEKIPGFKKLQNEYIDFIKLSIKECL